MSMTENYCLCSDGNWYGGAIWTDGKEEYEWFVCLDDDDPPELVVRDYAEMPSIPWFRPERQLAKAGFRKQAGKRHFAGKYHWANSVFGQLCKVPPVPQKWNSKHANRHELHGVFFDASKEPRR